MMVPCKSATQPAPGEASSDHPPDAKWVPTLPSYRVRAVPSLPTRTPIPSKYRDGQPVMSRWTNSSRVALSTLVPDWHNWTIFTLASGTASSQHHPRAAVNGGRGCLMVLPCPSGPCLTGLSSDGDRVGARGGPIIGPLRDSTSAAPAENLENNQPTLFVAYPSSFRGFTSSRQFRR